MSDIQVKVPRRSSKTQLRVAVQHPELKGVGTPSQLSHTVPVDQHSVLAA